MESAYVKEHVQAAYLMCRVSFTVISFGLCFNYNYTGLSQVYHLFVNVVGL